MPVDPEISLGLQPPNFAAQNPLGMIGQFATIQNALNQNRLFQQTFAARQQAGQIMSAAPDTETGLQQLMQDPLTAPFAPGIIGQVRQYQQTMTDIASKQLGMQQSIIGSFTKNLAAVRQNPGNWGNLVQETMAITPDSIKPGVAGALESLRKSLLEGINPNEAGWQQKLDTNVSGLLLANGITPDDLRAMTGTMAPHVVQVTGPQGQPISEVVGGPAMGGAGAGLGLPGVAGAGVGASTGTGTPGTGILATGPTATQAKYLTDRGTDMAQYQKALDTNVSMGGTIMQTVQEARDAMQQFRPGGGAETYARVAQFAQALGADPKLVDKIGNGNLAASQEFNKLMVNTVMGQIREQLSGIGGSRLSQMEFQSFQKNNPNIETDPRAIDKVFNFWTKLYQRDRLEQSGLNDYLTHGGDISQWPATWQKIATQRGYIMPSVTAGGVPLTKAGATSFATQKPSPGLAPMPAPKGLNPAEYGIQ